MSEMKPVELFVPQKLKEKVSEWRSSNYASEYPALSEILNFNIIEIENSPGIALRYLRKAQFEALETYWYLRIIEKTPHIYSLYKILYEDPSDLLNSFGIKLTQEDLIRIMSKGGIDNVFERIKTDDEFVKVNRLETVRETLSLKYPSYILALAMGAGKTVLIGSIIATEFALALEYPDAQFVKNALVFAPGKTILGALKEMSDVPFDKILPPRLYKQFMSTMKLTYTQDKEKDIPVIKKSTFNVIVTNTEKIRIQKPTGKRLNQLTLLNYKEIEKIQEAQEIANLRLQTIASLPNLAIFSDEAHHTYGQSLDTELKKVRKTVDYLGENTSVIIVVNTTGTPYYKKQMLRDVVYWYGLSQGIKDGILKEVQGSILSYKDISEENFIKNVLEDFFGLYKNTSIYNGAQAKIALYFPQTEDVQKLRPAVEKKVIELGFDPSIVLEVNNKSEEKIKDLFNNRINDPYNPYRVYLLVNMGTEGWNCPSLFATALARKLKSSNNFVLQAASRCLRQVSGNTLKARIYLSNDNVNVLDAQLKETYGESLQVIDMTKQELRRERIIVRKLDIPPIMVKKKLVRFVINEKAAKSISFTKPRSDTEKAKKIWYEVREHPARYSVLTAKGMEEIEIPEDKFLSVWEASLELSVKYRFAFSTMYNALRSIYKDEDVPFSHMYGLMEQIEKQTKRYKTVEEEVEIALALVRPEGFKEERENGKVIYTAEIMYHKDKDYLLLYYDKLKDRYKNDLSFHYSPYKMDTKPEKDFFLQILDIVDENPDDVEDMYFIGGITDPKKTDMIFEYKDTNGKWRGYTPDFVIRKKNGRVLLVEVKAERFADVNKEMALRELVSINPDTLKYEIFYTKTDEIGFDNVQKAKNWLEGKQ